MSFNANEDEFCPKRSPKYEWIVSPEYKQPILDILNENNGLTIEELYSKLENDFRKFFNETDLQRERDNKGRIDTRWKKNVRNAMRTISENVEAVPSERKFIKYDVDNKKWFLTEKGKKFLSKKNQEIVPKIYNINEFTKDTGFQQEVIEQWKRILLRKKHIIFQGPPGTGKTYIAERLAKLIIAGTNGFYEVIQFHPAYTYEDFIKGIRPNLTDSENLIWEFKDGRFIDFCQRAEGETKGDPYILIIDEINRANLSHVFGELMYLLEYRNQAIPLAGGEELFQIPENIYIIGTMNTADRSIALVDHALRRRFSFIRLNPDYDILKEHLIKYGYPADSLINVLEEINKEINNPNYEIGISFFILKEEEGETLKVNLTDIWKCEIEPYLEEFFYDQLEKVNYFRWNRLIENKLKEWVE